MINEFDLLKDCKKTLDELKESIEGKGLTEKSTAKQRSYIYGLCEQTGVDVRKYNMKDLSKGEASEIIEELESLRDFDSDDLDLF